MLLFRKREQRTEPSRCIKNMMSSLAGFGSGPPDHERALELLIDYGEFESAVTDSLYPNVDCFDRFSDILRRAGILTGHIFHKSWRGLLDESAFFVHKLGSVLNKISALPLPETIVLRVPEGYAHYGLYPETYLQAARKFFDEVRPERVVCIGMRSIGTSLSSAVTAALEEFGCEAHSFTVRPRGEPFIRRARLSQSLEISLRSVSGAYFAVIDEGPGLSGSSICCMAQRLSEIGIADEKIVLFPSWEPDGENFVSENARRRWQRHRKYTGSFEDLLITNGKLLGSVAGGDGLELRDISAGMWRSFLFHDDSLFPATHPNHEKRKFLCLKRAKPADFTPPETSEDANALVLKFAGLGRYGRLKLSRAEQLYESGFSQKVLGIRHGFISMPFVEGRPLSRGEAGRELLTVMADYLAFLKTHCTAERQMGFDEIVAMIKRNTMLGLGQQWANRVQCLEKYRGMYGDSAPVAVDGRMMPHEWIKTAGGAYIKTDGLDHHLDQFFPGCQDIAWDIAGSIIEFSLGREKQEYCIGRYLSLTHDRDAVKRIPFYKIAYLAFRVGFATFALRDLAQSAESERFKPLLSRYSALLKDEIARVMMERYSFKSL